MQTAPRRVGLLQTHGGAGGSAPWAPPHPGGLPEWPSVHDAICPELGVAPPENSRRATQPAAPRGQAPVGEPSALFHLL